MSGLSKEDRQVLASSLSAFVANTCDYETLRASFKTPLGHRPDWWRRLATEMGILGVAQAEDLGGMGGSVADLALVAEVFGHHLVNAPLLQSAAMGAELLRHGDEAVLALLGRAIEGEVILAPALFERASRYYPQTIATTATPDGSGWRLSGRKSVVRAAPWADYLIVSALAPQGLSLFLVSVETQGVERIAYPTFDGQRAADVLLSEVYTEGLIGPVGQGLALVEQALDLGVLIQSAEALGVMRHAMKATLDYVQTRKQFGQAIGCFQALQHRLADMSMSLARAEAVTAAGLKVFATTPDRARLVSSVKLAVDEACALVGEGSVQLHGAIGLTEELSVSHAFKRLTAIQTELGDGAYHQARLLQSYAA